VNKRDLGRVGERSAVLYLKGRGYKILHTNWTCYGGEIDIIATKDSRLIFVEVKSAFSGFCSPCELFNSKKKNSLRRSVRNFLSSKNFSHFSTMDYQVDLICQELVRGKLIISHYENVIDII
jgi:putative endonuclease